MRFLAVAARSGVFPPAFGLSARAANMLLHQLEDVHDDQQHLAMDLSQSIPAGVGFWDSGGALPNGNLWCAQYIVHIDCWHQKMIKPLRRQTFLARNQFPATHRGGPFLPGHPQKGRLQETFLGAHVACLIAQGHRQVLQLDAELGQGHLGHVCGVQSAHAAVRTKRWQFNQSGADPNARSKHCKGQILKPNAVSLGSK